MIQQKKLYIFLSKRTVWFWFAGMLGCLKPASKPYHAERILELRSGWSASSVVLFLDFPWLLTHFKITIYLLPNEMSSYAKMRLWFPNNPVGKVQSSQSEIIGNIIRYILVVELAPPTNTSNLNLNTRN